jgi:hypothetical protein
MMAQNLASFPSHTFACKFIFIWAYCNFYVKVRNKINIVMNLAKSKQTGSLEGANTEGWK